MKKTVAPLLLLAALLTGCTASPSTDDPTPVPSASAEPVGPIELSNDEAAERYLNIVCDNNAANRDLTAAFTVGEPEFLSGGNPDVSGVKAAASRRIDLNRIAIELLEDEQFVWPEAVAAHVPHIRSSYMAELATLDGMLNAANFGDAYYASWPAMTPEQQVAGQEIRFALGLDADTTASCSNNYGGMQKLLDEKAALETAQ